MTRTWVRGRSRVGFSHPARRVCCGFAPRTSAHMKLGNRGRDKGVGRVRRTKVSPGRPLAIAESICEAVEPGLARIVKYGSESSIGFLLGGGDDPTMLPDVPAHGG